MTTTTAPAKGSDILEGIKVIDCDAHWTEPPDLWVSRAPAKYKDRVPHMKTVPFSTEAAQVPANIFRVTDVGKLSTWFIEGDKPFGPVGVTVIGQGHAKIRGKLSFATLEEMDEAAYNVPARLQLMDQMGVHAQIIYPNAAGFSSTRFMTIEDADLRLQCLKIYNDASGDMQAESGGRLLPQALLPFWDQQEMLKEMRRAIEDLKLTGFTIADKPETMGLPSYDQPYWAPFWEYVNDKRVPLDFHIGAATGGFDAFSMAWDSFGFERRLAIGATLFYMTNAATVENFILSGLLDTYPNLKLVSVESGIGWVPFVIEALEYQLHEMIPTECKHLQRTPREYFRDHFYACFWFEKYAVEHMLDGIGVNNVLFETDIPHPTCLYPKSREHLLEVMSGLDPAVRKRILQDNAAELYKLQVPAS